MVTWLTAPWPLRFQDPLEPRSPRQTHPLVFPCPGEGLLRSGKESGLQTSGQSFRAGSSVRAGPRMCSGSQGSQTPGGATDSEPDVGASSVGPQPVPKTRWLWQEQCPLSKSHLPWEPTCDLVLRRSKTGGWHCTWDSFFLFHSSPPCPGLSLSQEPKPGVCALCVTGVCLRVTGVCTCV